MLYYTNLARRDYYREGGIKGESVFIYMEADNEALHILCGAAVRIAGFGLKALIAGLRPNNRYKLP